MRQHCLSIFLMYLFCRIAIVFPAIACDTSWSYADAWAATKNHKLLVIITVGIFPMILSSLLLAIGSLFDIHLLSVVFSAISTVIIVAALSATYQHIKEYELIS